MEKQMRPTPNLKKLQQQVDEFNAKFPVGSTVVREDDSGDIVETVIKGPAQAVSDGSSHLAVVYVSDTIASGSEWSGCVPLNRSHHQ
jgi:hypothetical protein